MTDRTALPDEAITPAPAGQITLALDIGGTGLKAGLLDAQGELMGENLRVATPHPSPPASVVPLLTGMATSLGQFDRVSVGFPGVVRSGRVLTAPNLGTEAWAGYDLAGTLAELLGKPVRVENDATVQGLGVISGRGLECVITLGTGFGFALYQEGRLAPHLEVSQHVAYGKKTYDEYVGVAALDKIGRKHWNKRVKRILKQLRVMINFDTLYIGGGDATKIDFDLPSDTHLVSNKAGLTGGVKLWNEFERRLTTTVHLVRHAAHGMLGKALVGRTPGIGLSADGVAQAAALADRFGGTGTGAVLSSPVERARQTAAPIAARLGLTVEIDAGLDEIDFGAWTGAAFATLDGRPEWDDWNRHRNTARCPDGETMMAAQDRAVAAVMRASARPESELVLVSHQDVLKAVLAHFLGISLDHLERFALDPASRSIVTMFDGGGGRVDGINLPP